MRFSFNSEDPQEVARAQRCVEDMLRRGYSIFVEVDGKLVKAKGFDAKTNSYVIADGPLYAGGSMPIMDESEAAPELKGSPVAEESEPKRGRGRPRGAYGPRKVPAGKHKATAVAPSAGG